MAVSDTLAEISSGAELRELLGTPARRVITKERTRLHERDIEWLAAYYGPQYEIHLYG